MSKYQDLEVWKTAMELVKEIYFVTKKYPKEELYSLSSQTKRAAVSVPSNIAEGIGRQYKKDTIQFLHVARGSLYELETHLQIAKMVNIVSQNELSELQSKIEKALQLLNGYINYLMKADLR